MPAAFKVPAMPPMNVAADSLTQGAPSSFGGLPADLGARLQDRIKRGDGKPELFAAKASFDASCALADQHLDGKDDYPDEVFMNISGQRVWGGSKGHKMKPKDEAELDVTFGFRDFCDITLCGYDIIDDDSLGSHG